MQNVAKQGLFGAQPGELSVDGDLGLSARLDSRLQPT